MNTTKRKTEVLVRFEVEHKVHPLKKFQAEGHFVPAIRERDADGNETPQPRKWKGAQVHALSLIDPETGEPARVVDPNTGKDQALARALSDSRQDAEKILGGQIRNQFWASRRALAIMGFNSDQARRVKDERDRMAAWMLEHHPQEFSRVLGIAEAAVEAFKAEEKSPALKAGLHKILQGGAL
jgi:hypothetical protein